VLDDLPERRTFLRRQIVFLVFGVNQQCPLALYADFNIQMCAGGNLHQLIK
jgi:hypothetical protein